MSEPRDRLNRPEDISVRFSRRRRSIGSGIGILADEPEIGLGTPFRWGDTAMMGTRRPIGVAATRARGGGGVGRGSLGTPRIAGNGRGRNIYRSPVAVVGQQNMPPGGRGGLVIGRGRGRGRSGSVLPSWYPRTPLRDITAIVREHFSATLVVWFFFIGRVAIERTRARLREMEGQQIESPIPQDQAVLYPSVTISGAPLEHDFSMISPNPTIGIRHCTPSVGRVPKILLDVTNQNAGESDFLTPQKKLLNSIDTVEKVVMEELRKLKRTPTAKKAEREKRVRTLMSMR
ncbi:unnamed protein product [Ilex paraguariensis]|uniref:Protein POLYCHOME n=1 Tax=Ilex paraguariensis TaxID=185542 RepID=A0ABC8SRE4_9AQUA